MGLWFNSEDAQVSLHPVHLPLKEQEATQSHVLHAPQEATPANEAATKISCSAAPQARLVVGRRGRGACLHFVIEEEKEGEFSWGAR